MKDQIDVNLWGTILSAKLFMPFLANKSRVLFISSAFGLTAGAGYACYCAAKAGIVNFALALRRELLGKASIYVACPADIDTPLYREELKTLPVWMKSAKVRAKVLSAEIAAIKIIKKCQGKRFLIFISWEIFFLLSILPRFMPSSWIIWLGDRLLPTPP